MMDSATPASPPGAPGQAGKPSNILEAFGAFKAAYPAAAEYCVTGELEARQILMVLIPVLRLAAKDVHNAQDRFLITQRCHQYQSAIVRQHCLALMRKMTKEDQIYLSGIKITAPKRWA